MESNISLPGSPKSSVDDLKTSNISSLLLDHLQSEDREYVLKTVTEMTDRCHRCKETGSKMFLAGGQNFGILAMKTWHDDAEIQGKLCRFLHTVAWREAKSWNGIEIHGGIELIVTALQTFPSSESVQTNGCGALLHWMKSEERYELGKSFQERGGFVLLISAMKMFPGNGKLQEFACAACKHVLNDHPDMKPTFIEARGVSAVATAIESHADNKEVCDEASAVMRLLF